MKKITLLLLVMFSLATYGQTVSVFDFESDFPGRWGTNGNPANQGGFVDNVNFSIVDNPSISGINTSAKVGKFHRLKSGLWWALAWFDINPLTIGDGKTKYLHISVYKPLASDVCIQLKDKVPGPTLQTAEVKNTTQTKVNEWQELVFAIKNPNTHTGDGIYKILEVKPDFVNSPPSGRLEDDIDIYFDNIYVNDDPNPVVPVEPIEEIIIHDFESDFPGRSGTNGNPGNQAAFEDNVNFTVVDNPSVSGINKSAKVGKFQRLKSGLWWALTWFDIEPLTIKAGQTHYLHISVYKPLASDVCIQLKDKVPGPTLQTAEVKNSTQTKINEWQELVFAIKNPNTLTGDGIYKILEVKPDFVNNTPALVSDRLDNDIDIYFDNIYINGDPNPVESTPTSTKASERRDIKAWISSDGDIHVEKPDSSGWAKLYSANGILLYDSSIPAGISKITPTSKHSVYILKINEKAFKLLQ